MSWTGRCHWRIQDKQRWFATKRSRVYSCRRGREREREREYGYVKKLATSARTGCTTLLLPRQLRGINQRLLFSPLTDGMPKSLLNFVTEFHSYPVFLG